MNFDLNWFLTVPGMFISAGVLLLVVAIIVLIVSSAKGKKEKKKVEKATPATPEVKAAAAVVSDAAIVNAPQTGNVPNQMPVDVLQQQNIPMMQQQNVPSDLGVQPAIVNNGMPQVNVMLGPSQMPAPGFQNVAQPNIGMTQNIPIVEPAPMMPEAPVVEPAPMMQSVPIVEPTPMVQEVPIVEAAPMMQNAPIVEPAPIVQEAPIVEPAPMMPEAPVAEPAPMMPEAPVVEPPPMVQEVQSVEPVPAMTTPAGMVPTTPVTPVMQSTPLMQSVPMVQTSPEVESLSYNQPVASYQANAYADNTNGYANVQNENVGVMPVASVAPATQPVIYGGASPIVSDLNFGQNMQHQIYGGANPLENTQSMPIMSTPVSNQTESVMPYGEASFSQTAQVTNGVPGSIQQ